MLVAEEVKSRIPILAIIGAAVGLKQRGHEWWGCCPFHREHTPSFHVDPDKNGGVWHCFGCGEGGDVFAFVMKAERLTFAESVQALSERYAAENGLLASCLAALPPAPQHTTAFWNRHLDGLRPFTDSPAASYLARRGIPYAFPFGCRVKYHPAWYGKAPAVVFPIRGAAGQLVAAEGRAINELFTVRDGSTTKVLSAGPKKVGVFATPNALQQSFLVIVESPINALSLALCGLPAVATCGAGNHPAWLITAARGKVVWTAYDPDTAGENGNQQLAQDLAEDGTPSRYLKPPFDGMDWNDCLQTYGVPAMTAALQAVIHR